MESVATEPSLFITSLRYIHISTAVVSFLIGPMAMRAPKKLGWHTQIGTAYSFLMLIACITAAILAAFNWQASASLFFVSIFSFSFLAMGWFAARNRKPGWVGKHITGMLGSYIALMTAVLLVGAKHISLLGELPPFALWILPTLIGAPLVRRVRKKFARN